MWKFIYPKYEKLEAIDGNKYSSWTNIRRYTTRDVFILAYVESLKLPLSESRLADKQINFLTLLKLTNIRFNSE